MNRQNVVALTGVTKAYGENLVLRGVDLELVAGEVHVLAGANGAGKSTLIRILCGAEAPDGGKLELHGTLARFTSPADARARGVSVIHQELSLVPSMSVVDNLFLGRETGSRGARREKATLALADVGLSLDVDGLVEELPLATQQRIEIARALAVIGGASGITTARALVMDEPTSALGEDEAKAFFAKVGELRERGHAVLLVTHRLDEIYAHADRISVLRDGAIVATGTPTELDRDALVIAMLGTSTSRVGRVHEEITEKKPAKVTLDVSGIVAFSLPLRARRELDDVSFRVRAGEIFGIAGVVGSGAEALLPALFGDHAGRVAGTVRVGDVVLRDRDPRAAIAAGMVFLSGDRKRKGLVLSLDPVQNALLTVESQRPLFGLVRRADDEERAKPALETLHLVAQSLEVDVAALSGGNQQKVVIARGMLAKAKVLLLDEPTRGVDVGAKAELHAALRELARSGVSLVVRSAETDDLLALCDRIAVLRRGVLAETLDRSETTRERILASSMSESTRSAESARSAGSAGVP